MSRPMDKMERALRGIPSGDVDQASGQHQVPRIFIEPHRNGLRVMAIHGNGAHDKNEHGKDDIDGVLDRVRSHLTGDSSAQERIELKG